MYGSVVVVVLNLLVVIGDGQESLFKVKLSREDIIFPRVRPKSSIQYIGDNGKSYLKVQEVCDGDGQPVVIKVRRAINYHEEAGEYLKVEKSGTYECYAENPYSDQAVISLPFEVKKLDAKSDTFINQNTFSYFWIDCGINALENRFNFAWRFTCNERDIRDQVYRDVNGRLHLYFVNEIQTNLTCTFNGSSHKTILSVEHNGTKFHTSPNCSSFHQRFDSNSRNTKSSAWSTRSTTMSSFTSAPLSATNTTSTVNQNLTEPFFDNTTDITLSSNSSLPNNTMFDGVTHSHHTTQLPTRVSIDPCASNPCRESSTCYISGTEFICACANGFSGYKCEIDSRVCQCSVNGSCPTFSNVNICRCPDDMEDQDCVQGIPKFVYAISNNVSVEAGENAVLECFVSSDCDVEWLLVGNNTTTNNIPHRNISGFNHNRLIIHNVSVPNTGTYRCACSNSSFVDINLNVTETVVLNVTISPKDGVYLEDVKSRYECSSDVIGYNLSYYINGKLHQSMNKDKMETMEKNYLLLDHDNPDRGHCVQCLFEYMGKKKLLQSCSLTISRIRLVDQPKKEVSIYFGSDLNITFRAITKPQTNLDFKMYINDILSASKLATIDQNTFRFLISNLTRKDLETYSGQYKIKVSNKYDYEDVLFSVVPMTNEDHVTVGYVTWLVPSAILIVMLICFIRKYKWIKKKFQDRKVKRTVSKEFFNMSAVDRYSKMPCQQEGFPRQRLRIQETLGEGNFGKVVKAEALDISGNGTWETVAVKMCKEAATDLQKEEFSHELSLVKRIPKHPNVVSYLGYCKSLDQPTFIILEYISGGNLIQFLRDRRPGSGSKSNEQEINSSELSSFAHQIAKGLAHLSHHNIIHRDVAARNILISESHICKVADLGLARDLYESDVYEIASKGGLPIRWMAPESLTDGLYTTQSDIWSYGVLLWEIITLGASPYPGLSARQVMSTVVGGNKLECPEFCSQTIKDLIMQCWEIDKDKRPTFDQICTSLERLLEEQSDYLNLQNYEEGIYSVLFPTNYDEKL